VDGVLRKMFNIREMLIFNRVYYYFENISALRSIIGDKIQFNKEKFHSELIIAQQTFIHSTYYNQRPHTSIVTNIQLFIVVNYNSSSVIKFLKSYIVGTIK
ncbi:hypothetical protein L9F63_008822, partial [Diploptera punctata]